MGGFGASSSPELASVPSLLLSLAETSRMPSAPSDDDAVDDEGPLPGTSSSDVSLALPAARRRDFEEGLLLKRPALKSLRITTSCARSSVGRYSKRDHF